MKYRTFVLLLIHEIQQLGILKKMKAPLSPFYVIILPFGTVFVMNCDTDVYNKVSTLRPVSLLGVPISTTNITAVFSSCIKFYHNGQLVFFQVPTDNNKNHFLETLYPHC